MHGGGGGRGAVGDITYAFEENSPPGTASGILVVEHDDYELYLTPIMMMFGDQRNRLSPREAAEVIWTNFMEQAGISYG